MRPVSQVIKNQGDTSARAVTQELINPRDTGALLRRLTEQVEILAGDRRSAANQAAVRKGDIAAVIDQAVTAALAKAGIIEGAGSPEGFVVAKVGTIYRRIDGSTGSTLYVKESGAGNTGWIAK
jgi:acyl-CoA synthetase (NDP forming)